ESEIFGFEAGAFTGAARARVGKLEHAHGGTLFLDEIESMPVSLQIKLLRVLQDRHVERLGSNKPVPFDARVVAASKEDLLELSQARKFREDLYYRLNVVTIELPPLRERREDIPLLFEHMVLAAAERYGRPAPQATSAQMHELLAYPWPGNVRELRNVADRFVLGLLDEQFKLSKTHSPEAKNFSEQVDRFERALIQAELRRQNGLASAAADALGLPKKTLYDKMRRFGLMASDFK
ncbi:MAG: sigma-54-dependent Fis family transcriptional regulator, partial [Rhodocyclaceae bacterium]|nr:sigma-54-dependent Fis family transcriptional regulator [Rhodocyclaceae bacterium]